jgi:VanW like protein
MSHRPTLRRLLRRTLPIAARWRVRAARRRIADAVSGVRFCARSGDASDFAELIGTYTRPLICYPGQASRFAAKQHNIALALSRVDGIIVAPGETFSFWRCVGRPTLRAGFEAAAALKDGVLVEDVGGAICLSSTLLYNAGLLSGMAIDERWCHSVDSYGNARYFELGRDAAVEYPYRDLRLRNVWQVPLLLRASLIGDAVCAEVRSRDPLDLCVGIDVSTPRRDGPLMTVCATRTIARENRRWTDELGVSRYQVSRGS